MKNKRLIAARNKRRLTQTQLGKMLGYEGKQSVSNWENGHSTPTLTTAIEIAIILNQDVAFLFNQNVQDSHTKQKEII